MHPFTLGDVVVCVNDRPSPQKIIRIGEPWIQVGRTYLISGVSSNSQGDHGVELLEVKVWAPAAGWHAWRFRRIYDIELGQENGAICHLELA